MVALTGTVHILIHSTTSASGNQDIYTDFTSSYSGIGEPSGVNYNGSTRTLQENTINGPLPFIFDLYQDELLQSQTSAQNFTLRFHFKITIDANGVATANIEDFTNKCGG